MFPNKWWGPVQALPCSLKPETLSTSDQSNKSNREQMMETRIKIIFKKVLRTKKHFSIIVIIT